MLKILILLVFVTQNCSEAGIYEGVITIVEKVYSTLCLKEFDNGYCPEEPPDCGTIFCTTRPQPTWVVNPDNACEKLPTYDWSSSCPANSKEAVGRYAEVLKVVNPGELTGSGQDEDETFERVCWKWRYCAAGCTECAAFDTPIQSISSGAAGCEEPFISRPIVRRKAKCNGGSGNGDMELGSETRTDERCTGPLLPCKAPTSQP